MTLLFGSDLSKGVAAVEAEELFGMDSISVMVTGVHCDFDV